MGCRQNIKDQDQITRIREAMQPLSTCDNGRYPEPIVDYFKCYGLDIENRLPDVEHFFGTFESNGYTLAGHIYKPAEHKGTVILLHGYLNHCVQLRHLIGFLVESGFAVAAFDLPGHGLSEGRRAAIEDFSQYSQALADFSAEVNEHTDGPYHVIGFSAGGSAVIDALFVNQPDSFTKVLLVAPLVHCVAWGPSKAGTKIFGGFVESVPRAARKESSDRQYLEFVKTDPLQIKTVPLEWVRALHAWNDKIANLPGSPTQIKVIQGTKDTTVDWKFNVEFIREKFNNAEVVLIEDGRHELLNESVDIRTKVFSEIGNYLSKNTK